MAEKWNEQTAKSFTDLATTAKMLAAEGANDFNFTKAELKAYLDTLYQVLDATLTSIAALGTAANKGIYTTGVDTFAEFDLTAAGRALLDDADAAAQRATLGLGSAATSNSDDFATGAEGDLAASALQNLIEDTTPQLGGDLDIVSQKIISSTGDIAMRPNNGIDFLIKKFTAGNPNAGSGFETVDRMIFNNAGGAGTEFYSQGQKVVFDASLSRPRISTGGSGAAIYMMQGGAGQKLTLSQDVYLYADNQMIVSNNGLLVLKLFTVGSPPSALTGGICQFTNDEIGAVDVMYHDSAWRRVRDGLISRAETTTATNGVRIFPDAFTVRRRLISIRCKNSNEYALLLVGNGVLVGVLTSGITVGTTSTIPTGTTGAASSMTVYEDSGIIYAENRSGSSKTFIMEGL